MSVKLAKIVCAMNGRGGVGKTTTTVNIAKNFGLRGLKTLIVDTDSQGSISQYFFDIYDPDYVQPKGLGDHLKYNTPLDEVTLSMDENLYYLPTGGLKLNSYLKMRDFGAETNEDKEYNKLILKNVFANLRKEYNVIVVDSPPGLSDVYTGLLYAVDIFIIPFNSSMISLRTTRDLIEDVLCIRKDKPNIRLLQTMVSANEKTAYTANEAANVFVEEYSSHCNIGLEEPIRKDAKINQSEFTQKLNLNSAGFRDYRNVTENIISNFL